MNNKNTVPMKPALLKIEQLRPFEGHPYKVQDNEEMAALSESIRENGVLSPLVVRSVESSNEYEVIAPLTGMPPPLPWWTAICTESISCPVKRRMLTS